jgi:hypothetical protein
MKPQIIERHASALKASTGPLHPNGLVGYNWRINFVEGAET